MRLCKLNKKMSIGVIGAGRIGKIHIENILRRIPEVSLKSVADLKIDNDLKRWANKIGIPNLDNNPSDIINDSEIDAIIIASSTNSHSELIQKAANAQKSIFCEKPLDVDLTRIKETLKVVNQNETKLMIGFNRRFDRNFKRVNDIIASGQIGEPQIIKITSRDPSPPSIDYIKVSGGLFLDMTIHDWDMARFQCRSEVEEVYATGAALVDPDIEKVGDIDTAVSVLKFSNGALGVIDNTRQAVYGYDQRVEVFGSKGCLIADNEATNTVSIYNVECTTIDKIPSFFMERYLDSYYAELKYFFECIAKNKDPKPNGDECLKNVLVALAAKKSLEVNKPIKISEVNS